MQFLSLAFGGAVAVRPGTASQVLSVVFERVAWHPEWFLSTETHTDLRGLATMADWSRVPDRHW